MPAAIENEPKVVKNAMNALPASSAASIASCFTVCTSSPRAPATGCELGVDLGRRARGARAASPRFEIITPSIVAAGAEKCWASASGSSSAASAVPAPSKLDDVAHACSWAGLPDG